MATNTSTYQIQQKTSADTSIILHPETEAGVVSYSKTIDGTAVTTVAGALDKIVAGIGVTGVKGDKETNYRAGNVNITAANVGAVAANAAIEGATNKTKISYDSKGLVTGGADLTADDIPNLSASKITSGTFSADRIPSLAAGKISSGTFDIGRIPTASSISNDSTKVPTSAAVNAAISTVTAIAEGKTKAYVASTSTGVNDLLKVLKTSSTTNVVISSFVDVNSNETITKDKIKVGDIIYTAGTTYKDWWVSKIQTDSFVLLQFDADKPDLSGYIKTDGSSKLDGVLEVTPGGGIRSEGEINIGSNSGNINLAAEEDLWLSSTTGKVYLESSDGVYIDSYGDGADYHVLKAISDEYVGSATKGVYIDTDGKAQPMTYSVNKDVPANAVFTDHYDWGDITSKPTTFPVAKATGSALGGIKIGYTTSGKKYRVELDVDGNAFVNVPWTDNNTTYSAGTGISLSGTTFSLASGVIDSTGTYSAVTVDTYGRVTAGAQVISVATNTTDTMPSTLATGGLWFKKLG